MADDSPALDDSHRTAEIRAERRRLAELEIARRQSRARLARLLATGEEQEAARLAAELRIDLPAGGLPAQATEDAESVAKWLESQSSTDENEPADAATHSALPMDTSEAEGAAASDPEAAVAAFAELPELSPDPSAAKKKRSPSPAVPISLAAHVVLVALLGLVSFAIQSNQRLILQANAVEGEDAFDDFAEVSLDSPEMELEELSPELEPNDLSESLLDELETPWEDAALGLESPNPAVFDALPTDMAGLMAGPVGGEPDGSAGSGTQRAGGKSGGATFFGSRSRGNRFVFVVDNSGSMQEGRMETTLFELLSSVRGMKRDQQFHVLFYSDQVYPMFFPEQVAELIPSTRENRTKLENWFRSVELCVGGKLREALTYAATLEPNVVYLLCDGVDVSRKGYGERNLQHLVEQRKDWNFVIHTLGMQVPDRKSAEALAHLAHTYGGAFTPVGVTPAAVQMSRSGAIKYNRTRGTVWGSKVRQ